MGRKRNCLTWEFLSYSNQYYTRVGEYAYLIDELTLWAKYRGEVFHSSKHRTLKKAKKRAKKINKYVNPHKFNIQP